MAFAGFNSGSRAPSSAGDAQPSFGPDATVEEFATHLKVPVPVVASLTAALGGDPSMVLEDFAFMAEAAVATAIEGCTVDEVAVTNLQKAQMNRLFHRARAAAAEAGVPVPGVIVPTPAAEPKVVAVPAAPAPLLLRHSAYLDQASESQFALLDPSAIRTLRNVYKDLLGTDVPSAARPTDEQLSALDARLKSGRVPYVDFAIFGPFDDRTAKLRKYTDQVFVGGVLQTKLLHGPQSFSDWQSCWEVFKSAMVMLKAATLGALNRYEEGLRQLWLTYGDWAVLSEADNAMRSREWTIVHDEFLAAGTLKSEMPWSQVIQATTFGEVAGPRAHWWWLHVCGPLTNKSASSAAVAVARLENRPTNVTPVPAATFDRNKNQGGAGKKNTQAKKGQEYCFSWNEGKCKHNCPDGRRHVCRYCNGGHRGIECPNQKSAGDHQKGGGKGGSKRKRKAGRGKAAPFSK